MIGYIYSIYFGLYLSTTMPARIALATLRNLRRSSRRRTFVSDLVNYPGEHRETLLNNLVNHSEPHSTLVIAWLFSDLVKVDVSQSLTCSGTASLSVTSLSSSSSSHSRLHSSTHNTDRPHWDHPRRRSHQHTI